jgi:glutaminyl-tRNA synthetase
VANSTAHHYSLLEHFVREDLNKTSLRAMAVLRPLKVVIDNYPEGQVEELEAINNPEDASAGTRKVPFSRVLYIEQDDFREVPPKQYYRLSPGREVRLRYAYFVTCTGVVKDPATGQVVELHCTYDPASRGGNSPDGRKVKSTIHWVSAAHGVEASAASTTSSSPARIQRRKRWAGVDFPSQPQSLEVYPTPRS